MKCFKCSAELPFGPGEKLSRHDTCFKCGADLRSCRMCAHFDASSYNECREPVAERILEKEKSNFCDYYKLTGLTQASSAKADALAKANALFKK